MPHITHFFYRSIYSPIFTLLLTFTFTLTACSSLETPTKIITTTNNDSALLKSSSLVNNGFNTIKQLQGIINNKPIISTNGSSQYTAQRNSLAFTQLQEINHTLKTTALTSTPFNREQQLKLGELVEQLIKFRDGAENTALLTQEIYQQSILLYQCNSHLTVEMRSINPNAIQISPLLQLNNEIQSIKMNMVDFSNSEYKTWSHIRETEINLISLDEFFDNMDRHKKNMFYLPKKQTTARTILNNCRYMQQKIDKKLQDILFNYEGLADYSRALKELRTQLSNKKRKISEL